MTVNYHEPGVHLVTRLVTVTAGKTFNPPITWVRCEGAGGTITVVAASDQDDAEHTFTLAAQGEIRGVAIRKCVAAVATGLIGGY